MALLLGRVIALRTRLAETLVPALRSTRTGKVGHRPLPVAVE